MRRPRRLKLPIVFVFPILAALFWLRAPQPSSASWCPLEECNSICDECGWGPVWEGWCCCEGCTCGETGGELQGQIPSSAPILQGSPANFQRAAQRGEGLGEGSPLDSSVTSAA